MKKIIISPWAKKLRNGKENPKNYPYWNELVSLLKANRYYIIQIGIEGENLIGADDGEFNLSLKKLKKTVKLCDTWISIDSFFQHLASPIKKGIVLWSLSSFDIFGYKSNINLLKSKKYLRENQFDLWENCEFNSKAFVDVETVIYHIKNMEVENA